MAGCPDGWCVSAPHPGEPLHVDATGFTWSDAQRRLWGQPPEEDDATWEECQDAGTFPGWV